jgi:hypothetical protein
LLVVGCWKRQKQGQDQEQKQKQKSEALSLASTPPTNSSGTPVVADEAGSLGMTIFLNASSSAVQADSSLRSE